MVYIANFFFLDEVFRCRVHSLIFIAVLIAPEIHLSSSFQRHFGKEKKNQLKANLIDFMRGLQSVTAS